MSEDFSEEELPKKKKAAPARGTPKRAAGAKRGRKRKQETESEEESEPEEEDDQEMDSDDSEVRFELKKTVKKIQKLKNR